MTSWRKMENRGILEGKMLTEKVQRRKSQPYPIWVFPGRHAARDLHADRT